MANGVVMWDFDGTLAHRPGLWGGCVLEVLDELEPGHQGTLEGVRECLRQGFPWHRHDEPHTHVADAEAWWAQVTPLLERAIATCGATPARAGELALAVRRRFVDGTRGWRVFPDSFQALERTSAAGWRNVILSNHVPELEQLIAQLGFGDLVEAVFSSGLTGYEKPHPEAFAIALRACGEPQRRWMVGDNPLADVAGAEALGIPAVLVRTEGAARRRAPDAVAAAELIVASPGAAP